MPKDAATHNENRGKICLICCKKKGRNSAKMKNIVVKGKLEALINKVFEYSADNVWLPNALCNSCNVYLHEMNNGLRETFPNTSRLITIHTRSI